MRRQRARRASVLGAVWLGVMLSSTLWALPRVGEQMPTVDSRDLLDHPHSSSEWKGRRTLVVAITDKDAGEEMRRWFEAADTHLPPDVRRASIVSVKLPFFTGAGMARDQARRRTPEQFWSETWLDRDGAMAKTLGLAEDRVPYVIALDEQGHVLASVHATAADPRAADEIWRSFPQR